MAGVKGTDVTIHVAFRFHGNFYHSYRGDTPDELGFGKDIRIIRRIIAVLDDFNRKDVPVCGTWDLENYFSLETIMPRHCPDIIESIRRRVNDGYDEIELMSYNNGLLAASNAAEFEAATEWSITNSEGSGVKDIFGGFAPVVRPQEMMYTPSFIRMYRHYGIEALSLYYSAIPFTCFSAFIPSLPVRERFNPQYMRSPLHDESMVVIPACNHGDLVDNLSLRSWLKRLRREQMKMKDPCDLLLLIDFDADDEFWLGLDIPLLKNFISIFRGLKGFVDSIKDLPFIKFTTPHRYLMNHSPLGSIAVGQDTADGSFDGYASWAEKWSNHQLWTGIERARMLEMQSLRLLGPAAGRVPRGVKDTMKESFQARVKSLSTTHFGMAAPVMNRRRLETAARLVGDSVAGARKVFEYAMKPHLKGLAGGSFSLVDYTRGVSTGAVRYRPAASRALVRLVMDGPPDGASLSLKTVTGKVVESALMSHDSGRRSLLFVETMPAGGRRDYRVTAGEGHAPVKRKAGRGVLVSGNVMENEYISLSAGTGAEPAVLSSKTSAAGGAVHITGAVTYGRRRCDAAAWRVTRNDALSGGLFGIMKAEGEILFESRGLKKVRMEREFILSRDLPYLYCTVTVMYPRTETRKFNRDTAKRLQQEWDGNWMEVMPFELSPDFRGTPENPVRIWKHNYFGDVTSFDPDYSAFSRNRELDSVNNQVTCGWVAVTNGSSGLLIAQTAETLASMAFCPMRTRRSGGETRVYCNPFGSYSGTQYHYPSAYTGLGRIAATTGSASDHLKPYAPSYNGRTLRFSLMVALYGGDRPQETITADALAFAYPYIILSKPGLFREPNHRDWEAPDFFPQGMDETVDYTRR